MLFLLPSLVSRNQDTKVSCFEEAGCLNHCCGAGSVGSKCFWVSWIRIRIHKSKVRFRILYQQAKIVRKSLIPTGTVLLLLFDFLSLKNDVNVPLKSNMQKHYFSNLFFGSILKVSDENSRIRIRIRIRIGIWIHLSEPWIRGSGSIPKCHGSATLV
jgi:hypothetical protein